jgi:NADPH-dependent 2,4-dienoyl-CoA reductase/sulfur reductase-like enzyme/nitrite reductase/ring-hydroxylating ferredoxin subunit
MKKSEIKISQTNDLQNGEMKTLKTDNDLEVLLIKLEDRFYALEPYCPHYGAPLESGIFSDKKIMCPWHHAMFEAETGNLVEPPALNGLTRYQLNIRGSDIFLVTETDAPERPHDKTKKKDDRQFLIIGGGAAGNAAARNLREQGFEGRILVVSADSQAPYDRTNLSKDFLTGEMDPEWLPLNDKNFYEENDIELMLNQHVIHVNEKQKEVELDNKKRLKYDKLLVATGGRPKKPEIPGINLENIMTLRSVKDAEKILASAQRSKQIVILGASFIGMESAQNLASEERKINVIAPETIPFARVFGEEIGNLIRGKMEDGGIHFYLGNTITEFRGNRKIEEIVLENGDVIPAEMAVIGVGIEPVTDFMPQFKKAADGGLLTDIYLQVENDIFAAGDIATFPYWKTDELIRVEHWRVAEQLGRIAAYNMLEKKKKVEITPFFWTNLAGIDIRYSGYTGKWDTKFIHGDLSAEEFLVYYTEGDHVNAVLGVNRDQQMAIIEESFRVGEDPRSST